MNEPSNFRLKDAEAITIGTTLYTRTNELGENITEIIDGEDVQRIRILNDIVWEKNKPTSLTLTSTPSSTITNKSFSLIAIVVDSKNNGVNGNVIFYEKTIQNNEEKYIIKATIPAQNGVATFDNVHQSIAGTYTYKAVFQKTGSYMESINTTDVVISKEQPKLTIYGETIVYNTWKIGVKLTDSSGSPLSNQNITLKINNGTPQNITTNAQGIASYTINDSNLNGTYNIAYTYAGNDTYDSATITQQYTIKNYLETQLSVNSVNLGKKENRNQMWKKNSNTSFQCYETGLTCYRTTKAIATAVGIYKNPSPLSITFNKPNNISYIQKSTLTFDVQSLGNVCYGSYLGGWFDKPSITLNTGNANQSASSNQIKGFTTKKYDGYSYSSHDIVHQNITWGGMNISSNPVIKIDYDANKGVEEACIKITNLYFKIMYTPKQNTTF